MRPEGVLSLSFSVKERIPSHLVSSAEVYPRQTQARTKAFGRGKGDKDTAKDFKDNGAEGIGRA